MSRRLQRAFRSWMRLEMRGREERAEKALRRVFLSLPELPLPAGLAERILARAGIPPAVAAVPSLGLRLAVALGLLLLGLSFVLLPGTLATVAGLLAAVSWTEVALAGLVGLVQRVGEGLAVWRALSDVGGILAEALYSPKVLAVLTCSALLSAAAFRMLYGLMMQERRSRYAGSP